MIKLISIAIVTLAVCLYIGSYFWGVPDSGWGWVFLGCVLLGFYGAYFERRNYRLHGHCYLSREFESLGSNPKRIVQVALFFIFVWGSVMYNGSQGTIKTENGKYYRHKNMTDRYYEISYSEYKAREVYLFRSEVSFPLGMGFFGLIIVLFGDLKRLENRP